MTKLTNEQIERILEGAPDGATHTESGVIYYKCVGSRWACHDDGSWIEDKMSALNELYRLDDLRENLSLRVKNEELSVENSNLRQEIERLKNPWISVEDELPDAPEEVVGILSSGAHRICKYCAIKDIWMEAFSYERLYSVAYWMPPPNPPKEQDHE